MNETYTHTRVLLNVESATLTPDDIEDRLGRVGAEARWRDEDAAPGSFLHRSHHWALGSGLPRDRPFEEHVAALLAQALSVDEELRALAEQAQLHVSIVLEYFGDIESQLGLALDADWIATFARWGAGIDVEQYWYASRAPRQERGGHLSTLLEESARIAESAERLSEAIAGVTLDDAESTVTQVAEADTSGHSIKE